MDLTFPDMPRMSISSLLLRTDLSAKLLRSAIGSAVILIANRFVLLMLGIVLARYLGTEGYGIYSLAISIMSLLMVAAVAGAPALLTREIAISGGGKEWGRLRGVLIWGVQYVTLVSITVSVIGITVLVWFFGDSGQVVVYTYLIMLFMLPLDALGRMAASILRGLHKVVISQAVFRLIRNILTLSVLVTLFFFFPITHSPQYAMSAQLASLFLVLLIGGVILRYQLPKQVFTESAVHNKRKLISSALPFVMMGGAGIINANADIIMLGWLKSPDDAGIYKVAVHGSTLVIFGLEIVNAIIAPHVAHLYSQGNMMQLQKMITTATRVAVSIALPSVLVFMFGGDIILGWIFGEKFVAGYIPLVILALSQLINAAFGMVGLLLNMTGHERYTVRALWLSAGINVVLNLALIPAFGTVGAAAAAAVSLVVFNVVQYKHVKQKLDINPTIFS